MAVKTFQPKVSVVLKKNIGRTNAADGTPASERFTGAAREIDLTPWLGEGSGVTVSKSVRDPAGLFSVTLADRLDEDAQDSLYGLVEPMDVVEIRMARDTSLYASSLPKHMPILMRGFVGEVRRRRMMTERGPERAVVIAGQDYGKILQIMRIIYLPGMVLGQDLLSSYKLFLNYGVEVKADQAPKDFFTDVLNNIVLKFLGQMRQSAGGSGSSPPVLDIKPDFSVTGGVVSPLGAQEWPGGTVYELLSHFGNVGPWNELFVEDREDAPYLVYRPNPFKSVAGAYIQAGASAKTVDVADEALVEDEVSRSDDGVANYYWVDAPNFQMLSGSTLQNMAMSGQMKPAPFVKDQPNCSPDFYGVRLMQVQTEQGQRLDGKSKADIEKGQTDGSEFLNKLRQVLIDSNKDNVVLESGSMQLRGDETIRAGCYVRLKQGVGAGFTSERYAHSVTHDFAPMRSFTTTVAFNRGTGFVERIKRGGGAAAPYYAEMDVRGVYGA